MILNGDIQGRDPHLFFAFFLRNATFCGKTEKISDLIALLRLEKNFAKWGLNLIYML
jgi:hypothetical protein